MYKVDVYLRVRRAVMVEGKSIREVSREFGLHQDTVRKMLAYSVPQGTGPTTTRCRCPTDIGTCWYGATSTQW